MSWAPLHHQTLHHDIIRSDIIYDIIRSYIIRGDIINDIIKNDIIDLIFMYSLISMLSFVFIYNLVLMYWSPLRHQTLHHDMIISDVINDVIRNGIISLSCMQSLVSMLSLVFMYNLVLVYWTSNLCCACVL